ncbi:MAG: SAM-dependent methyltransferase [Candidatus Pacearchaeota archaeon]
MPIYIIEHLEKTLYPWCMIEYKNISRIVGKDNLWFTNIRRKSKNSEELKKLGRVIKESVAELNLKNACILDPEADNPLEPNEAKAFDYFVFGGILGDYPPRKRTHIELTSKIKNAKSRNIGKKQFSTDNAVLVVKQVTQGKSLKDMRFVDNLTIKINEIESVELPYCYPVINNKPQISEELVNYLKRKRGF